jgi:hypothetical protein
MAPLLSCSGQSTEGSNLSAVINRPSLSLCLPDVELITPHIGCCRSGRARHAATRRPQTFSRFALFPPRRALHAARTIRGCDLPRRAVPVLLMPAVGLTLSLPQRIGTLSDLLVLLPIHGQYPTLPRIKTNSVVGRYQTAPGLQPGAACLPNASAPMRTNRLLRRSRYGLPHGGWGP